MTDIKARIESRLDIQCYIQNLLYALDNDAEIMFQEEREVDKNREEIYTNKYTVADLFPDENPVDVFKRELRHLSVDDYIKTVKDTRFKNRSEMREFGRIYDGDKEVYIKIRVELLANYGKHSVFIMSFHYSDIPFEHISFPYKSEV